MCEVLTGDGLTSIEFSKDHSIHRLFALRKNLKRIHAFLLELQTLSQDSGSPPLLCYSDEEHKELFERRIIQVKAEIQDTRDILRICCLPMLTLSQQTELSFASIGAKFEHLIDPSVRFFGIDWNQLFKRMHKLSNNIERFVEVFPQYSLKFQLNELVSAPEEAICTLLTIILRDIGRIEADVRSHAEAVFHGRLSKLQQELVQQEQTRYSMPKQDPSPPSNTVPPSNKKDDEKCHKISKSQSFREAIRTSSSRFTNKRRTQQLKYKKNCTTDISKIISEDFDRQISISSLVVSSDIMVDENSVKDEAPSTNSVFIKNVSDVPVKRTNSFIKNVVSIFKHNQ